MDMTMCVAGVNTKLIMYINLFIYDMGMLWVNYNVSVRLELSKFNPNGTPQIRFFHSF